MACYTRIITNVLAAPRHPAPPVVAPRHPVPPATNRHPVKPVAAPRLPLTPLTPLAAARLPVTSLAPSWLSAPPLAGGWLPLTSFAPPWLAPQLAVAWFPVMSFAPSWLFAPQVAPDDSPKVAATPAAPTDVSTSGYRKCRTDFEARDGAALDRNLKRNYAADLALQYGEALAEDNRLVTASNATYSREQHDAFDAQQKCYAADAKNHP